MWAKAVVSADEAIAHDVLSTADPGGAKRLGRSVAGFGEVGWAKRSWEAVLEGNRTKFNNIPTFGSSSSRPEIGLLSPQLRGIA